MYEYDISNKSYLFDNLHWYLDSLGWLSGNVGCQSRIMCMWFSVSKQWNCSLNRFVKKILWLQISYAAAEKSTQVAMHAIARLKHVLVLKHLFLFPNDVVKFQPSIKNVAVLKLTNLWYKFRSTYKSYLLWIVQMFRYSNIILLIRPVFLYIKVKSYMLRYNCNIAFATFDLKVDGLTPFIGRSLVRCLEVSHGNLALLLGF